MYNGMKKAFGPSVTEIAPVERWAEHYQELYSRENIGETVVQNTTPLAVMEENSSTFHHQQKSLARLLSLCKEKVRSIRDDRCIAHALRVRLPDDSVSGRAIDRQHSSSSKNNMHCYATRYSHDFMPLWENSLHELHLIRNSIVPFQTDRAGMKGWYPEICATLT